jgi:thioredoxin reductase (NADPH)
MGRAYVQAQKFGAEMVIPSQVVRLDCGGMPLVAQLHAVFAETATAAR